MIDNSDEHHIESKSSAMNLRSEEEHGLSDSHSHSELERVLAVEKQITKVSSSRYRILPSGIL
jgi:hypothetical protein